MARPARPADRTDAAVALTVCRFTALDRGRWLTAAGLWLTDAERAHARRLTDPDDRAAHAIGRVMMRLAGTAAAEQSPREGAQTRRQQLAQPGPHRQVPADQRQLPIALSAEGKPYLAGLPRVQTSLAHTQRVVVLASADGIAVGVDIERPEPAPTYPPQWLARRRFVPSEADWLSAVPPDEADEWFARFWTAKEAVGKALGSGIGSVLSGVVVEARGGRLALVRVPGPPSAEMWTLHELCAPGGSERIAVALPAPDVRLRSVSLLTLADLPRPRRLR